ncbi:signal peptide peptidase SppA [Pseudoalteromonas sp. TAB23]|uniref:signal peptide peptidase SppA n=1 Tax=Pseudoalteromonas sp. TAB23 TaxID=1938595 RepID=UPI000463A016|nr:signal peptide peptidase SppA [Pseudoalteromonas sp. TAB23]
MTNKNNEIPWERELLRDFMFTLHKEQVKDRRWRMLLKLLRASGIILVMLIVYKLGAVAKPSPFGGNEVTKSHIAYINIKGEIAPGAGADADNLIPAIKAAFESKTSKAVVLRINSPGGSPVQSGRIYEEIKFQKEIHPNKKVYAVIGDIGASGGYYIAAAADEIYADQASLVGSIGVISSGFGFTELMNKLGIERRAIIAGENKALLDPFSPLNESTRLFWEDVLERTHTQFITRVKEGRGDRLKDDPRIFSGLIWNGEQALDMGLVDGLGSMNTIARGELNETNLVDYTPSRDFFQRITQTAKVAISSFANEQTIKMY